MKRYSFTDLAKTTGEILDTALVEPVFLTKHGKEKIVMLSADTYRQLTGALEIKAHTIETAPADIHDELMQGINRILDDPHA